MIEQCERMLELIKDNPRWPGVQARRGSGLEVTFAQMDESVNRAEVAFWERRLEHYRKMKVKAKA